MAANQDTAFYAYINTGIGGQTFTKDGTATSYENIGIEAQTFTKDGTYISYLNTGIEQPTKDTIIRQPHGWGIIPTGPQVIVILDKQATGTATAYENTM